MSILDSGWRKTDPAGGGPDGTPLHPTARSRGRLPILMALVGIAVLAIHWPGLSSQALFIDDIQYLSENPLVRNPSWSSAKRFLGEVTNPSTVQGYYQPLAMISLMLDCARGGRTDTLRPFHQTALCLHVMNTVLVIGFIFLVFGNPWTAALVGLLFGLHPLTVEPATWLCERKTLLATFFSLWSLIFYLGYARASGWGPYVGCIATYVLALMAKPTATALPLVMILLDYWPLGRLGHRAIIEKVPLLMVFGLSAAITVISQGRSGSVQMPQHHEPGAMVLTLCHNIIFYLWKILWPTGLTVHYAFPKPMALSQPMVLVGVIGTCVLIPALLVSWRWTRAFVVGWMIFFVIIFPTMGVIGFTHAIASDRYVYLPSIGLLLVVAWALGRWWDRSGMASGLSWSRAGLAVAVLALAGAEALATHRYLSHWRDKESLFRHMVAVSPNQAMMHSALGTALSDQGRLGEAVAAFEAALRLDPEWGTGFVNLGGALLRQGHVERAAQCFDRAIQLGSGSAMTHYGLGVIRLGQGRTEEGIAHLREAVRLNPRLPAVHYNLAVGLVNLGKADDAIGHYQEALRLDPGFAECHNALAVTLIARGQTDQAIQHLTDAVRLRPGLVNARKNLAAALSSRGKTDLAIEHYREVVRRVPGDQDARAKLDALLGRRGTGG